MNYNAGIYHQEEAKEELNDSIQDFWSCPVKIQSRNHINMKQEHHTPFPALGKYTCMN